MTSVTSRPSAYEGHLFHDEVALERRIGQVLLRAGDYLVHCAGDVSFDPPVDEGFRTNVVGTRDLLGRPSDGL